MSTTRQTSSTFIEPLPSCILTQLRPHFSNELSNMDLAIIYHEFKNSCFVFPIAAALGGYRGTYGSWEDFVEEKTIEFLDWCQSISKDGNEKQKIQRLVDYFDHHRFADDLEDDYWFIDTTDDRVAVFIRQ